MDEGIADELTSMDDIDRTHHQSKEREYSLPGSSNMSAAHEMVTPCEGDKHDRSDIREVACAGPRCMGDNRDMVEELTLGIFNGENLSIMGLSENRESAQIQKSHWQHLSQMIGGPGCGISRRDAGCRDMYGVMSNVWGDIGCTIFQEPLEQKILKDDKSKPTDNLVDHGDIVAANDAFLSSGGIRTKILSKSGFSEYFIKNTLKGKGVVYRSPAWEKHESTRTCPMEGCVVTNFDLQSDPNGGKLSPWHGLNSDSLSADVCLREWLKAGLNKVSKVEALYIFRRIVDLVEVSHSQGAILRDLRPSYFKLLPSKKIIYLGSFVHKEILEFNQDHNKHHIYNNQNGKRPLEHDRIPHARTLMKKQKYGENVEFMKQWPRFSSRSVFRPVLSNDKKNSFTPMHNVENENNRVNNTELEHVWHSRSSSHHSSNMFQHPLTSSNGPLEEKWYTCPEDLSECGWTISSNIYSLGVFLFELLSSFESERDRAVAMLDLRHRILPPQFLSENPKEAGFCLWLLHPEPSSRPTTREILKSEVLDGIQVLDGDDVSSSINVEDAESELLLHFLLSLKEQKQKDDSKLVEEIRCIEVDIQEVIRRQTRSSSTSFPLAKEFQREDSGLDLVCRASHSQSEMRLMKNIRQLESAYFSVRSGIQPSTNDPVRQTNTDLLNHKDSWYVAQNDDNEQESSDWLGKFFNGLCKYGRFSKFEVRGVLSNGYLNHSANVICSLSFNRDEEYFAAAGVSKKIKIYEFPALFDDSVDIHYPVVELLNKSKLSCVCWNSYIRNYLASTDYEGIVKIWDAGTGQELFKYIEHDKRAWSVDFSQSDPTRLASGSDDCSVKLWSINEINSLCTIKNIANVCSVQFSADSSNLLSFGSADYKTYCYDLRNTSQPWCILAGHHKAVSYVKFLDSKTIVSASTDNTLKIWDLSKTSSYGLSTNACILTLRGHTNEKNFVGLAVADGYIACGSETNEVYAYFRSLPMPITSHKFGSTDPVTGKETDDDNGQFVSSVCWRQKSDMVVTANSSGCIKLLQMV